MSLPLRDKNPVIPDSRPATLDRLHTAKRSTFNLQPSTHPKPEGVLPKSVAISVGRWTSWSATSRSRSSAFRTTTPKLPRCHSPFRQQPPETRDLIRATLSTGIEELDQLLKGGVPRGRIVEIVGAESSGKTSLMLSVLAQSTGRGEITAYVDLLDSLDPRYARAVGVDLDNLLWIRCARSKANPLEPSGRVLKAADILCQAGGFGVIAMDLADSKVSLNTWFRLQRVIRGTPTVLAVISSQKTTGSASSLVLFLKRNRSFWTSGKRSQFVRKPYLHGIESEACLVKGRGHGSVTIHCRF